MVEVRNLSKRYGNVAALDGVSFTLNEGGIYGLLGRNGAGKSTTMNIMTGYLEPSSGDVLINGISMTERPVEAKKHIGYLPEIPPLYIDMTVKEYLHFAAELKRIPFSKRREEVEKVVEFTGLQTVINRLIRNLSKGYKQRVGMAYALMGFPKVIILDEPTAGVDPGQITETRELIRSIGKDHIIIFSSHVLSEVQSLCDHILILRKGKLVAQGSVEELEALHRQDSSLSVSIKVGDAAVCAAVSETLQGRETTLVRSANGVAELSIEGYVSAEERRNRTDQALLTAPIRARDIIGGKYVAMVTVFLIPNLVFLFCPLVIRSFGSWHWAVDYAGILVFFLLGCTFISAGLFISCLTENQLIAAVGTFVIVLVGYLWDTLISYLPQTPESSLIGILLIIALAFAVIRSVSGSTFSAAAVCAVCAAAVLILFFSNTLAFAGLLERVLENFSPTSPLNAVVEAETLDLRGIIRYLSFIFLFLFLSVRSIERKRRS